MANDTDAIRTWGPLSGRRGAENLIALRIDDELRAAVDAEATARGCSRSAFIRQALTESLAKRSNAA